VLNLPGIPALIICCAVNIDGVPVRPQLLTTVSAVSSRIVFPQLS
jgi:hypothetical protein